MTKAAYLLTIFFSNYLYAQEFNISTIPDSLMANANVIKRYEETILEIKSPGKYISHERHVYTILNDKADDYADYKTFYDRFTTIDYLSGKLYNAKGKELKHVKKADMADYGDIDGYTMINDIRYRVCNFSNRSYPYTVDFEEDDTNDGVLSFPGWIPVQTVDMAVQYSKYVIIAPKDYEVRYKQLNFAIEPVVIQKGDAKIYTWEIKNIHARIPEILAPREQEIDARMLVAPSDFEAEGYKGNMSTWENYGKFIYLLTKGRDVLPEETKQKVHALTDKLTGDREKINVLYDFLQKNTHYISIQLGIGGWQPLNAEFVSTKKYGDCKALSNYMISLLKEAGITAKYVEIRGEENSLPIITDFPEFQFNHVICCVPMQKDTVWLECTSASLPAGYLSGFTSNRWGLLSDATGGKLVHTPKYDFNENVQARKITATVSDEGNLSADVETQYKAMEQDRLEGLINNYSNDRISEYLKRKIDLPTYYIQNFHYTEYKKDKIPYIKESIQLTASNYAQITGKRLFINPNILTKSNIKLPLNEVRMYDVELYDEYTNVDTVSIKIPDGYVVESVFQNVKIQSEFGTYTITVKVTADSILYVRKEVNFSGRFPASDYANLVQYYEQVYKADHKQLVYAKRE